MKSISVPHVPSVRSTADPLHALLEQWEIRAQVLDPYLSPVAAAFRCCIRELGEGLEQQRSELLSLTEAARESGYSTRHLARAIAAGSIANAGHLNAPKVRRADLPRKAGHLPPRGTSTSILSATQIARSVVNLES